MNTSSRNGMLGKAREILRREPATIEAKEVIRLSPAEVAEIAGALRGVAGEAEDLATRLDFLRRHGKPPPVAVDDLTGPVGPLADADFADAT